jgi:8-oxo-dGTP pyrophosphatase MutT (NUDIX family)
MIYCCGFLMSWNLNNVVLIKNRQGWGKGIWNGIGGKLEDSEHFKWGEKPILGMVREFEEETSILINKDRWTCYDVKQFKNGTKCYFFVAFGDEHNKFSTYPITRVMVQENEELSPRPYELATFDRIDIAFEDRSQFAWDLHSHLQYISSLVRRGHITQIDPEGINSAR